MSAHIMMKLVLIHLLCMEKVNLLFTQDNKNVRNGSNLYNHMTVDWTNLIR